VSADSARSRDHPAAFVAWVVVASAVLTSATAITIGSHRTIPWDTALYPVMFGLPGALIASRVPLNPIGWLMLFVAAEFAATTVGVQWLTAGIDTAANWWAWWVGRGGGALLVPATLLLLLLLPDGRLPSPRWRGPAAAVLGLQVGVMGVASFTRGPAALDESVRAADGLVNPVGFLPESWDGPLTALVGVVLTLPFLLAVPAVIVRLRRADEVERPRIAGVLAGVLLFALLVTVPDAAWPSAAMWFHILGAAILTGSILVAVLRGDFEQIEIAISRALIYGALTVIVAAVYMGAVVLVTTVGVPQRFAGAIAGAVALALLPARNFAQAVLRRAIYGSQRGPTQSPDGLVHGASPSVPQLSRRENEIMRFVAQGMTNAEIAAELFISPITVRNHVSSILAKLDATNRTQAVARFNERQQHD